MLSSPLVSVIVAAPAPRLKLIVPPS